MPALQYTITKRSELNLIQNGPAVKKVCGPQECRCEKDVKSKVAAKNGCDGRLIAKNLSMTIQVNLLLNPSKMWRRQHKFA